MSVNNTSEESNRWKVKFDTFVKNKSGMKNFDYEVQNTEELDFIRIYSAKYGYNIIDETSYSKPCIHIHNSDCVCRIKHDRLSIFGQSCNCKDSDPELYCGCEHQRDSGGNCNGMCGLNYVVVLTQEKLLSNL